MESTKSVFDIIPGVSQSNDDAPDQNEIDVIVDKNEMVELETLKDDAVDSIPEAVFTSNEMLNVSADDAASNQSNAVQQQQTPSLSNFNPSVEAANPNPSNASDQQTPSLSIQDLYNTLPGTRILDVAKGAISNPSNTTDQQAPSLSNSNLSDAPQGPVEQQRAPSPANSNLSNTSQGPVERQRAPSPANSNLSNNSQGPIQQQATSLSNSNLSSTWQSSNQMPTMAIFPPPQTQRISVPTMDAANLGLVPTESQSGPTAKQDAISLHTAFKGTGCDVGLVVKILSHRPAAHRARIQEEYKSMYSENLIERLSAELSGKFKGDINEKIGVNLSLNPTGSLSRTLSSDVKRAVSLWMLDEAERDATIVGQGLSLTSVDLPAVTEVLCSRTPSQLLRLKRAYFAKYGSELADDVSSPTLVHLVGSHKKLLVACLNTKARDERMEVDPKMAEEDARELYNAGEKRWGTDEITFIRIFTQRNRAHLAEVDSAYHRLYGHSLEKAVEKETSRYFKYGLLTLLRCAKNPAEYFAQVLHEAMKGLGTSDTTLIRVVLTRAEIDMKDIMEEFAKQYKKSLRDAIHSETSGHYRTFLLNIMGSNEY